MARRGSSDEPSTLSEGSLTAAEGCVQWYHVNAGDSCYSAIATVDGGLALDSFYTMNPQINEDCFNLWAGFDYCVSRTTTSSSSSATTSKAVVNNAVVHAVKTTTSQAPAPTTTAAPTSSATAEEDEEDCDAEDETEEWASSTTAPVRAAVAQTTTAAPATSTDDSAAKAAASKSSADAAWASSSKSSADAAWASSSKAAADAAWASSSQAAAVKTTTSAAAETTKVADTSSNNALTAAGITGFLGENKDAVLSWFNTNSAQDSTNGNSWCYRPYDSSIKGFAPSLKTMLANFNGDPIAAGKAYCGLIAEVTTPEGRTAKLVLADAFDDTWVLTPSSLDIIHSSFAELFGSYTENKQDVVTGATWKFTGERDPTYVFNNGNPV